MMRDPFVRFENKADSVPIGRTKIVEAFGIRKCPKLVEQVNGDDLEVRNNALLVLCDEFRNPYCIEGTIRVNIIPILAGMVTDNDYTTRLRSAHALSLVSLDSVGARYILEKQVIPEILLAVEDKSKEVRGHIYDCILNVSRLSTGIQAAVEYGAVHIFLEKLELEIDELKPVILRSVNKMVGCDEGLIAAMRNNAVQKCIALLKKTVIDAEQNGGNSSYSPKFEANIIVESAKALGFLCFDGRAKESAIENDAITELVKILKLKTNSAADVKAAITAAIMAITITDAGKVQMHEVEGPDIIMQFLYDESNTVKLNCLKIISNIAVYPPNREILKVDSTCILRLTKLSRSDESMLAKHASIALKCVTWTP